MVVFVCSTYRDLMAERNAVLEAIRGIQHENHSMEFFGARPGSPIETCLEEVQLSDLLVVVVSYLYGRLAPNSELSFTQTEYEEGNRLGKPCLVYLRDDSAPLAPKYMEQHPEKLARLRKFKDLLSSRHTIATFRDALDLGGRVRGDLTRLIEKAVKLTPRPNSGTDEAEARLVHELDLAASLQRELLPQTIPETRGLEIAGRCIATRSVGGDYYQLLECPQNGAGLIIADVFGKGLRAALMVVSLHARVLLLAEEVRSVSEFVRRLNSSTCRLATPDQLLTLLGIPAL